MKKSLKILIVVALALFALLQIDSGTASFIRANPRTEFGCDLRMRRNEVRCAHLGINSFHVWNNEISLPGFLSLDTFDREGRPRAADESIVHAYPPWHTALFYFYGWLSEPATLLLVSLAFVACFVFAACECVRHAKARFPHPGLVTGVVLALIAYPASRGFMALNYGPALLVAFLLMDRFLEKKGWRADVAAGLAWSFMMIKPQAGLLFFWPLFWRRRYLAIAVAAATCLAGTLVTSCLVHESALDLILQISRLRGPYGFGPIAEIFVQPFAGANAGWIVMGTFFVLSGLATGLLRKNRDFFVLCIPVVLSIPLWTYSLDCDRTVLLPAFLILVGHAFSSRTFGCWGFLTLAYCVTIVSIRLWWMANGFGLVDALGHPLVFIVLTFASNAVLFAFLLLVFRDEVRREGWRAVLGFAASRRVPQAGSPS